MHGALECPQLPVASHEPLYQRLGLLRDEEATYRTQALAHDADGERL